LLNPSIQLEEDGPAPVPETPPGKDNPTPTLGTPLDQGGVAPTLEDEPGTSAGPIGQDRKLEVEITTITRPPNPDADWRRAIFEYLRLRPIPDNILQLCIPIEEGKALVLDMRGSVEIMPHQEALSKRLSSKVSTGRRSPATRLKSCGPTGVPVLH
jgi:hypothetical protein